MKYKVNFLAGLLQPLSLPSKVWEDISIDFIIRLPKTISVDFILVVVVLLTKYGYFIAL